METLVLGIFIRGCSYIDESAFLIQIVVVDDVVVVVVVVVVVLLLLLLLLLLIIIIIIIIIIVIVIYFFFKTHLGAHVADRIIASLSKDVSERRTTTESRLFALMGSVFAQNNWQDRLSKNETLGNTFGERQGIRSSSLLVEVSGS